MNKILVLLSSIYNRFSFFVGGLIDKAIAKLESMDFGYQAELAKHGALQTSKFAISEIKARPRIRLASKVVLALALVYLGATSMISYLEPKKADVKVYGHQVLVAEAIVAEPEPEINEAVVGLLSPFEAKLPVSDGYVSQGYHGGHAALDIATAYGAPIRPLGRGIVMSAGRVNDGKGNIVVVDHGEGLKSLYAHMGSIYVNPGDMVNPNSNLGTVGMTGHTTGPHVHMEIYDNERMVNPENILPK